MCVCVCPFLRQHFWIQCRPFQCGIAFLIFLHDQCRPTTVQFQFNPNTHTHTLTCSVVTKTRVLNFTTLHTQRFQEQFLILSILLAWLFQEPDPRKTSFDGKCNLMSCKCNDEAGNEFWPGRHGCIRAWLDAELQNTGDSFPSDQVWKTSAPS